MVLGVYKNFNCTQQLLRCILFYNGDHDKINMDLNYHDSDNILNKD